MMRLLPKGHLKAGYESVKSAKLRSFWTMLGIIIGVASVITIVSIGEGVKQQITGQIQHLGKDLITVRPAQLRPTGGNPDSGDLLTGLGITAPISSQDVKTVAKTRGVGASAPLVVLTGQAKSDVASYNEGFVIGTTADFPSLVNQSVGYGSFISDDDAGANVAVLGVDAAEELFDEDIPLGRIFTYKGQDFIVRGIFNTFNTTPINQEANFNKAIFIPEDVAATLSKNAAPIYEILAKPTDPSKTGEVADRIDKNLIASHGGQSQLLVTEGTQNLNESDSIVGLLTRLIAGVAAISLIVGGIGIMNVMLVSVAERTREIGIRKAVGATNRQILEQFLVEATVLSFFGGVIGILLAYFVVLFLRLGTSLTPVISWQVVLIATGVSLLVGIIFGTIPALKAARRDPIDALRAE